MHSKSHYENILNHLHNLSVIPKFVVVDKMKTSDLVGKGFCPICPNFSNWFYVLRCLCSNPKTGHCPILDPYVFCPEGFMSTHLAHTFHRHSVVKVCCYIHTMYNIPCFYETFPNLNNDSDHWCTTDMSE